MKEERRKEGKKFLDFFLPLPTIVSCFKKGKAGVESVADLVIGGNKLF